MAKVKIQVNRTNMNISTKASNKKIKTKKNYSADAGVSNSNEGLPITKRQPALSSFPPTRLPVTKHSSEPFGSSPLPLSTTVHPWKSTAFRSG